MAFTVKKSILLFVLTILLSICSSHANDDIPHVREGHRKLNIVGPAARAVPKLLGQVSPTAAKVRMKGMSKSMLEKVAEIQAQKAFAAGFRVGWKGGKWYYSVKEKCQEHSPNLVICNTSPTCFFCENADLSSCYEVRCVPEEFRCTYRDSVSVWGPTKENLSIEEARTYCSIV